jgi:serine/threonine-protein kinase
MASGEGGFDGLVARRLLDGRYRLGEELARGGAATVWRAWDLRLDLPVAVKLLTPTRSTDPKMLERLRREARTLAGLTHPNVVGVRDLVIDSGRAYLVMELIEGRSLAARLADGPLPVWQAAAIAAGTCDALAAMHAIGVVHRDIRPANIVLPRAGTVKVMVGTSLYLAPQKATGAAADTRTDLYALGCVLYAMLTGDVLHLHQPRRPLHSYRADIPPDLERLTGELLDKNPDRRPADAALVRNRLAALTEQALAAATGTAAPVGDRTTRRPPTPPTLYTRFKPRPPVLLTVAAALLATVATGAPGHGTGIAETICCWWWPGLPPWS